MTTDMVGRSFVFQQGRVALCRREETLVLDGPGVTRFFEDSRLVIVQTHEDDLRIALGPAGDMMTTAAAEVHLIDLVEDPEGITDKYVEQFVNENGHPPSLSPGSEERRALKKAIRREEGTREASVLGVDSSHHFQIGLDVPFETCVVDATGRFRPYQSTCRKFEAEDSKAIEDIALRIAKLDRESSPRPLLVAIPGPEDPHPHHHATIQTLLEKLVLHKATPDILIYEIWNRFDELGFESNFVCFYGEDELQSAVAHMERAHPSQTSRFDYSVAMRDAAASRARRERNSHHVAETPRNQFASRLMRARLRILPPTTR
jgi:LmbE family N-acetylglucosaminyl deacetylase